MKSNVLARKAVPDRTHEGGRAEVQRPDIELERAVLSCLLFENTFYESGNSIGKRIAELCAWVPNQRIFDLAVKARSQYQLRHVPLYLLVQVAKKQEKNGLAGAMAQVIQRPDEMGEFLALYWRNGRAPLAAQVKKGLARAFGRFSAHELSKWNRDSEVKLRDVMFLTHPKPSSEMSGTFKAIAGGTLEAPDTWEVALSAGSDKKATWERLLSERKLGIMALLMNLRNMEQAKVDRSLVKQALREVRKSRAFPYRFMVAAKNAPWLAQDLSDAMLERIQELPRLRGTTHVLVDVSGSMDERLSSRSDATRLDAASSVGIVAREVCEDCRVFTFSHDLVEVKSLKGLALGDGIQNSQQHGRTYLGSALNAMKVNCEKPDRIIVITDEQSHDDMPFCHALRHGYIVNVAPYKPGLPAKSHNWTRINGWSDRLVDYIAAVEHESA